MDNFTHNIDKLITGTKDGKILWEPHGKNYIWKTQSDDGQKMNVVLQATFVREEISKIMFRLWDIQNQTALMDIYTDSSSENIKSKIFELYNIVRDKLSVGRIDILSDLLKNI